MLHCMVGLTAYNSTFDDNGDQDLDDVEDGIDIDERGEGDVVVSFVNVSVVGCFDEGIDLHLRVVGTGPYESTLRELATRTGASVEFMGKVTGADLGELMCRSEILTVPSRWAEPFGIVALEGIASGCVVVASSDGGLADAVGSAGVLFPNGDQIALNDKLRLVCSDADLRAELRARGRDHAVQHHRERMVSRYLEVLNSASGI